MCQFEVFLFDPALVSVGPLIEDNLSHLSKGEVCVGKEVSHLTISVVDIIEQVPLDRVVLVIPVAVDGGAVVARHVPQLVGLVPEIKYWIILGKC